LVCRHVFFSIDGRHGALWDAHGAVNALVWVNGEEVGAFAEAIYGANVYAIGVLTTDTGFGNDVCHGGGMWVGMGWGASRAKP
jgi:hypothetical protein